MYSFQTSCRQCGDMFNFYNLCMNSCTRDQLLQHYNAMQYNLKTQARYTVFLIMQVSDSVEITGLAVVTGGELALPATPNLPQLQ